MSGPWHSCLHGDQIILAGLKVTDTVLLACLEGLSDVDIKYVGVALGINNVRLEKLAEGQTLAEVVADTYRKCTDSCKETSWEELDHALVAAGHSELAKRMEINRSEFNEELRYSNYPNYLITAQIIILKNQETVEINICTHIISLVLCITRSELFLSLTHKERSS